MTSQRWQAAERTPPEMDRRLASSRAECHPAPSESSVVRPEIDAHDWFANSARAARSTTRRGRGSQVVVRLIEKRGGGQILPACRRTGHHRGRPEVGAHLQRVGLSRLIEAVGMVTATVCDDGEPDGRRPVFGLAPRPASRGSRDVRTRSW